MKNLIVSKELIDFLTEAKKPKSKGKICEAGKKWAMRKFGKWSAYAAMAASKYCLDPNYAKDDKN